MNAWNTYVCDTLNLPRTEYTYPFLTPKGRRRDHGADPQPLAQSLDVSKRARAHVLARDLYKENSIFKWSVDFSCQNLTSFAFHADSRDPGVNRLLNDFWKYFNETADISGRYTYEQLMDCWAHRKMLDGDVLVVRLDSGRLQTIQSNWITDGSSPNTVQGVYLDSYGRSVGYHVERITSRGQTIQEDIPAKFARLDAWYDYEVDSYRGVTPWISALSTFQDLGEVGEEMTNKIKLEARLGLAIKRRRSGPPTFLNDAGISNVASATTTESGGSGETQGHLDTDGEYLPRRKPQKIRMDDPIQILNLEETDDLVPFSQTTPSSSFGAYFLTMVAAALKAGGVPVTIYQENLSNYYCSRAAYGLYQNAIKDEMYYNQCRYLSDFRWAMAVAQRDGVLDLPASMTAMTAPCTFLAEVHSVLDEDREAKGSEQLIRLGQSTPQAEAAKRGRSYEENIDAIAAAKSYANARQVTVTGLNDEKGGTNAEI